MRRSIVIIVCWIEWVMIWIRHGECYRELWIGLRRYSRPNRAGRCLCLLQSLWSFSLSYIILLGYESLRYMSTLILQLSVFTSTPPTYKMPKLVLCKYFIFVKWELKIGIELEILVVCTAKRVNRLFDFFFLPFFFISPLV